MIRALVLFLCAGVFVWAPWMDTQSADELMRNIGDTFGPVPGSCYDSDDHVLQNGVAVRWYPFGRLVHTCAGDFVFFAWGNIKELGGLSKGIGELQAPRSRPLTCALLLEREKGGKASTSDKTIMPYTGEPAEKLDFSLFPEAADHSAVLTNALQGGPTYAGAYAVASFECGANCQNHAVIDVATGRVIAYGLQTEYGVAYTMESDIFVTNPINRLPPLPEGQYETEVTARSIARLPREYYKLTTDTLSSSTYLVRLCVESSATGYIEVEDDSIGVHNEEKK